MLQELPENPTPQDFGFPANPTFNQLTAWHNQERFLAEFSKHGRLNQAAAAVGLHPQSVHRWNSMDLYSFKRRRAAAMLDVLERYEAAADQWALEGIEVPIMKQGQCVGTTTKRSELLMMFRMKRLDPAYKDNYQPQTVQDNRSVTIINNFPSGPRQIATDYIDAEVTELPDSSNIASTESVTDTDTDALSVDE